MPSCAKCQMLVDSKCSAHARAPETLGRTLPPPPLGSYMMPIFDADLKEVGPRMRVLDVGCGSWDHIKNHCHAAETTYEGIDVHTEYFGRKTVATRLENLDELLRPISNTVIFELWGTPPDPLPPSFPYPGFWTLRRRPAYVLDIRAMKDQPLPGDYDNRGAASGRLAQLLRYSVSHNVFRVLRKAGRIRGNRSRDHGVCVGGT